MARRTVSGRVLVAALATGRLTLALLLPVKTGYYVSFGPALGRTEHLIIDVAPRSPPDSGFRRRRFHEMFAAHDLHWEIVDLFSVLTGVAEIYDRDRPENPDTLRPIPKGRRSLSCKWIPPRRRVERTIGERKAADPESVRARARQRWASLTLAEKRSRIAARPALTPEQTEQKRQRERERYYAAKGASVPTERAPAKSAKERMREKRLRSVPALVPA